MGDFNAEVGIDKVADITGGFGLGIKNTRVDRLVQFCKEENFKITNTWFKLPKRRLYTWISPRHTNEHIIRNQNDYILINKRFGSSVLKASTYPGADVPSNHNLLVAKIRLKPTTTTSKKKLRKRKIDYQLKSRNINQRVNQKLNDNLRALDVDCSYENL